MWGRMIGLVIIIPAVGFWARGMFGPALKARAGLYIGLVVAQGLLGWWMVKSGLKPKENPDNVPRVSQYRLAAHLGMALLLYSSMLYTALGLLMPPEIPQPSKALSRLRQFAHGSTALVFFTALSGMWAHTHTHTLRPWESGMRCMVKSHFPKIWQLFCCLLWAYPP